MLIVCLALLGVLPGHLGGVHNAELFGPDTGEDDLHFWVWSWLL